MTRYVKVLLNIIVVIALVTTTYFLVKRASNNQSMIWWFFNINDIFFSISLLIFINFNLKIGMFLSILSFSIYIIIVITSLSNRLLTLSSFFRFCSIVYIIYFVINIHKKG
jgi:hypothetical protein